MSNPAPFSGLIEMPDTGPPASDADVQAAETGGEPQSGSFKSFWENHQLMMMLIGLGVLLLTAVLVFRKSQSNQQATTAGGVPTVNTSDTASAITQQNNSIEALLNAFQKFTSGINPNNVPTNTGSTMTGIVPVPGNPQAGQTYNLTGITPNQYQHEMSTVRVSMPSNTPTVWGTSQATVQPVVSANTVDHTYTAPKTSGTVPVNTTPFSPYAASKWRSRIY